MASTERPQVRLTAAVPLNASSCASQAPPTATALASMSLIGLDLTRKEGAPLPIGSGIHFCLVAAPACSPATATSPSPACPNDAAALRFAALSIYPSPHHDAVALGAQAHTTLTLRAPF
jgi:hypothetical protein